LMLPPTVSHLQLSASISGRVLLIHLYHRNPHAWRHVIAQNNNNDTYSSTTTM